MFNLQCSISSNDTASAGAQKSALTSGQKLRKNGLLRYASSDAPSFHTLHVANAAGSFTSRTNCTLRHPGCPTITGYARSYNAKNRSTSSGRKRMRTNRTITNYSLCFRYLIS